MKKKKSLQKLIGRESTSLLNSEDSIPVSTDDVADESFLKEGNNLKAKHLIYQEVEERIIEKKKRRKK